MNKNRGIWLVIAAILIIGIAVTFATSRFIRQNGGSLDTVAVTQMPGTTAGGGMPQAYTEGARSFPPQPGSVWKKQSPPGKKEQYPGTRMKRPPGRRYRNLLPPG